MSIRRGNLVIAAKGIVRGDLFKTFVVDDTVATDFNSTNDEIIITSSFVDLSGNTITFEQLSIGDNIIVKQLDVPDRYVMTKTSSSITLGKLETVKITVPTSINGFSGGSLTSPLVISGGNGTNAAKIALDNTRSGQLTDSSTKTIFGFLTNNTTTLTVGNTDYDLNLRGNDNRPTYNGNDVALSNDIPTSINGFSGGTISSATNIKGVLSVLNSNNDTVCSIDQNGDVTGRYLKGTRLYTSAATDNANWTDVYVNDAGWIYKRSKSSFKSDLAVPTITATSGSESITDGTNTLNFGSNAFNSTPIPTVNDASLTLQFNGNTLQTFTANASSNVTANIQALPNYSLTINHNTAGNPRHVKFLSINYANYTSNASAYIKLGAMSCHGNGTSYQFLDDIIIGCYYPGDIASPPAEPTVVCQNYKFIQVSCGAVDGTDRNYGDIYYTIDTTNKIVDFYILCGQYASSQFTPFTKIGSTITTGVTQYSGTASYYSSGTKVWAGGNSTTYARKEDIPTDYIKQSAAGTQVITSTSSDTPIAMRSNTAAAYVGFQNSGGTNLGFIGVNASGKPVFYDSSDHRLAYSSDIPSNTDILNSVYPVGSIYITVGTGTTGSSSPASFLGGTWTRLPDGYTLWTASSGAYDGTNGTIAAGLPNIKASWYMPNFIRFGNNPDEGSATGAGSITYEKNGNHAQSGSAQSAWHITNNFNANSYNSVYNDNTSTVQPPAIKVYMWRRTA